MGGTPVHTDTPPLYRGIPPLNPMVELTVCCYKSPFVIQPGFNSHEYT